MSRRYIFLVGGVLFCCGISMVHAADLSLVPAHGSYVVGSTFTVTVRVAAADQAVNAYSGTLSFPIDTLQVVSLSKTGSVVNLWVQDPSFSNQDGSVHFEGVTLNPGFKGAAGTILSITFRARSAGSASVRFASGSLLANDGQGTNILSLLQSGTYVLATSGQTGKSAAVPSLPIVQSSTHPDQEKWYNSKTLSLSWSMPRGVDGVSYAFHTNPDFIPAATSRGLVSQISYDLTTYKEGIWYFHIRFHNENGWGPVAHRKIQVDFSPPPPPPLIERAESNNDPSNPRPVYQWSTLDTISGIALYKVKIGSGEWFDASSIKNGDIYTLPLQTPGTHTLQIQAVDYAGNTSTAESSFVIESIPVPIITSYSHFLHSPQEAFMVEGTSIPLADIHIFLRQGTSLMMFSSLSDALGKWSLSYASAIPPGTFELKAQAIDSRGAVSDMSAISLVTVSGWFSEAFNLVGEWGLLLGACILLITGLIWLVYFFRHHHAVRQLRFKKDLVKLREALRDGLTILQKDFEHLLGEEGTHNAARHLEHVEARIKKEARELQKDIQDEVAHIDRMGKKQ